MQHFNERSFRIFPLKWRSKLPAVAEWQKRATADMSEYVERFGRRADSRNTGIATGHGLIVIDIDVKGGQPGLQSLKSIQQNLTPTYTVVTPTGGLHLYYSTDMTDEQAKELGAYTRAGAMPGIDIRGAGGYVVAAGSETHSGRYDVKYDRPIAQLPVGLLALLKPRDTPAQSTLADSLVTGGVSEYSELPARIPMGERDDTLFRYACSWRERSYPRNVADILMAELYKRLEQTDDDRYTIEAAMEKVERAWAEFPPGGTEQQTEAIKTTVETPIGEEFAAGYRYKQGEVENIQQALERFILVESLERVVDLSQPPARALYKRSEFRVSFGNVRFKGSKKSMPDLWLESSKRKTVRDVVYRPGAPKIVVEGGQEFFNVYQPTDLPDVPKVDEEKIRPFFEHMKYFFPDHNDMRVFLSWLCMTIQHPEVRIPWAPLLITEPGLGKGWIFNLISILSGPENCRVIREADLESAFNGFLSRSVVVCLDDIEQGFRAKITKTLKPLMTETRIHVNHKYGTAGMEPIFANFLCFSNQAVATMFLEKGDRRFWVYRVDDSPKDSKYYTDLFRWLDTDGPAHLLAWIMCQDMTKFCYGRCPDDTKLKLQLIEDSLSDIERILRAAIEDREGPFEALVADWRIAATYVASQVSYDTNTQAIQKQIQLAFSKYSYPLRNARYRIKLDPNSSGNGTRISLRAVVRVPPEQEPDSDVLSEEYRKAFEIANKLV